MSDLSLSRRDLIKVAGALGLVAAAGGSILPLAGCGKKAESVKTLKIGMMTPRTGPVADKGAPGHDGLVDCVEYINTELGGVNGYQIDAVYRDSAYDAPTVVSIVNDFMNQGCILFTAHSSTEMSYAKDAANRAEFPGLAGFSPLNVWRMRAFYEAYAGDDRILSQPVTELAPAIVQQPARREETHRRR